MFHTPAHLQTSARAFPATLAIDPVEATRKLDTFTAVGIAEGFLEARDEDEYLASWQHLVNTGLAWRLQGWFGRTAQHYIDMGYIEPAGA